MVPPGVPHFSPRRSKELMTFCAAESAGGLSSRQFPTQNTAKHCENIRKIPWIIPYFIYFMGKLPYSTPQITHNNPYFGKIDTVVIYHVQEKLPESPRFNGKINGVTRPFFFFNRCLYQLSGNKILIQYDNCVIPHYQY